MMDEQAVRKRAEAMCQALVAGDVERVMADFSAELRRNLGEVLTLFPLPATDATVESVERGGSGYVVVIQLVGETDQVQVQTRWKDRDGHATLVEASHLSRTAIEAQATEEGEREYQGAPNDQS